MPRKPDTRTAAMLGIARRELHIKAKDAARACGRSQETLCNLEVGVGRMADEPTRRLVLHYLGLLGAPARQPDLPIAQLVEELARALLLRRARSATELLAAAESGADAVVVAIIRDGLRPERLEGKVCRRLLYRLDAEARRLEGADGG